MNKRAFLKTTLLSSAAIPWSFTSLAESEPRKKPKVEVRLWARAKKDESEAEIRKAYKAYYEAGVRLLYIKDSEKHCTIAKENNLMVHRWMYTINRGAMKEKHPEWYAINREGQSCATHPPYVGYYRWLCPSRPEVKQYLEDLVLADLQKPYIDGIHLDYVRYCDVILPVNLWGKYDLDQTKELPQFDYCYCNVCRTKFKEEYGIDPMDLPYPSQSLSWRNFRYDRVTDIVNHLAALTRQHKKEITAAVFATPEVARRMVRQDWTNWPLSGVSPMMYHKSYHEEISWIGDAVAEGTRWLCNKFPLYAGIHLKNLDYDMEALKKCIAYAMQNGAAGVTLYGTVTPEVLDTLKRVQEA